MPIVPLSDQERQAAQEVVSLTPQIMEFLDKCAKCGLPVEDRQAAVQTDCDFCKAVLENFFGEHV